MAPDYPVAIDRRVFVPMDDGTRIAVTLYRPDAPGDGPFPAVIESLPYRKDDDCTARDWSTYAALAAAGIAGVRIDIRGTGASTGIISDEYVAQEQADTLAVMEWVAAQEWCTGDLGMWGISWGGFSALQTAMLRPPQLKAIAPMHATHDRFACDVHYTGGSLHAQEQAEWPTSMVACNALPPDPDIVGDGWYAEWMARLEHTPQWPFEWLRHQRRDEYWLHGSPCADYAAIECPTLLIGGWLDGYIDGMVALAEHLTCPTRLVVGPWGHYRPATGVPGPTLDHFDLLTRWFAHHLRGDANGVMEELPAALVYVHTQPSNDPVSAPGRWRCEPEWPPADLEWRRHDVAAVAGSGATWSGPEWVGSHAPAWDRAGLEVLPSMSDDDASVVFEVGPFPDPFEILGAPEVGVAVASDGPAGMVAARLVAVSPEGDTFLVSRGNRNMAFPEDLSDAMAVVPGQWVDLRFPLLACSVTIPPGWFLRLAVAGADFPVVWPPGRRVRLSIDPDGSALLLPVVPPRSDDRWVDLPEAGPAPEPPVEVTSSNSSRTIRREKGVSRLHRSLEHAERQPTRENLEYSAHQEWTVEVADDDPATTAVSSSCTMRLRRGDWEVTTVGRLGMTADAAQFHVRIELVASLGEQEVFSRTWTESVPRRWA